MLISDKIFQKVFKGETSKQAYLSACKWVATHIVSKAEIGETFWSITKSYKYDSPACILELYVTLDEKEFVESNCNKCKEFHNLFYMNQQFNCDACNMTSYRKGLEYKLSIKKSHRKGQLRRELEDG